MLCYYMQGDNISSSGGSSYDSKSDKERDIGIMGFIYPYFFF